MGEDIEIGELSWQKLDWSQLTWMYSEGRRHREESDIAYRFRVWMHLNGLELFGQSYYAVSETDQTPFMDKDDIDAEDLSLFLKLLNSGPSPVPDKGPVMMILLRKVACRSWWSRMCSGVTGLFFWKRKIIPYGVSMHRLFQAVRYQTGFIDTPQKLTYLPIDVIRIGRASYQVPQKVLGNLTYEQYGNCQHALTEYWKVMDRIVRMAESGDGLSGKEVQLGRMDAECRELQIRFLAHVLTPEAPENDRFGNRQYIYSSYHADLMAEDWARNGMRFRKRDGVDVLVLFSILYQMFQSTLILYKSLFPHVFADASSSGKGARENPIVSELGTLNAIMKYQGYSTQQEVYDTNALIIFKILDSMTKEAKEMERISRKTKAKHRN